MNKLDQISDNLDIKIVLIELSGRVDLLFDVIKSKKPAESLILGVFKKTIEIAKLSSLDLSPKQITQLMTESYIVITHENGSVTMLLDLIVNMSCLRKLTSHKNINTPKIQKLLKLFVVKCIEDVTMIACSHNVSFEKLLKLLTDIHFNSRQNSNNGTT